MQNPTDGDSYRRLETPQTRHLPRGGQGPPWQRSPSRWPFWTFSETWLKSYFVEMSS